MSTKSESWVRVESESELRAGMAIQLRPCRYCGRVETQILLSRTDPAPFLTEPDGTLVPNLPGAQWWNAAGKCISLPAGIFVLAIPAGRLYRLALDEPAAEETERTRERERTR